MKDTTKYYDTGTQHVFYDVVPHTATHRVSSAAVVYTVHYMIVLQYMYTAILSAVYTVKYAYTHILYSTLLSNNVQQLYNITSNKCD